MEPVVNQQLIIAEKFWTKRKIIWTILSIFVITFISIFFIRKYFNLKPAYEQKEALQVVGERIEELSVKDYTIDSKNADTISKKIESLSAEDYKIDSKNEMIIGNRLQILSQ